MQHFIASPTLLCSDATTLTPARNAYVKVYIKLNNSRIEFYKDGYTDRRGKFDYVSLNTGQMQVATDIAILVCGADGDCNVTRANPPAGLLSRPIYNPLVPAYSPVSPPPGPPPAM